jgi:hypothetical protein
LVSIFEWEIGNGFALGIAGDDDGEFPNEGDELFENGSGGLKILPGRVRIAGGFESELTFSVVAEGGRFEASFA